MSSGPASPSEDNFDSPQFAEPAVSAGVAPTLQAAPIPREAPDTIARQTGITKALPQSPPEEGENGTESTLYGENKTTNNTEYSTPDIPPLETIIPPPDEPGTTTTLAALPEPDSTAPNTEQELDIFEHLGELRQRLLYCIAATALGLCVTWNFGPQLTEWFSRPIREELQRHSEAGVGNTLITIDPTEAFVVYLQITLVAALLLVMPFILFQLWRFIEPALTVHERRYGLVMVPFAVVLFFTGVLLGYAMAPVFFRFFLAFQPPGIAANFGYGKSAALLAKMLLVFGVCFQVPVITIFLHKIGLVTRNVLIEYWRHVFIVIFIVVAILTPTWDPFTLIVCAGPPCALYILSIWLVKWL